MIRLVCAATLALVLAAPVPAAAGPIPPREGWEIAESAYPYDDLLARLKEAVRAEGMFVVTEAGPTAAARRRGIVIPGNRVVGVFRNDFAVRVLETSIAAMIEAPIRFYVTEDTDGAGWLSYERPGAVFAPYAEEGGAELRRIAEELDTIFAAIAARTVAGAE